MKMKLIYWKLFKKHKYEAYKKLIKIGYEKHIAYLKASCDIIFLTPEYISDEKFIINIDHMFEGYVYRIYVNAIKYYICTDNNTTILIKGKDYFEVKSNQYLKDPFIGLIKEFELDNILN